MHKSRNVTDTHHPRKWYPDTEIVRTAGRHISLDTRGETMTREAGKREGRAPRIHGLHSARAELPFIRGRCNKNAACHTVPHINYDARGNMI